MSWLALFLARRTAAQHLGFLAEAAARGDLTLPGWRRLVAKAAENGDLDNVFEVYVNESQRKARAFIEGQD